MARGAADGLDERALRSQEPFLVRIEDRHQRHLGQIQAFAQQVDSDQDVEFAQAQVAVIRRARPFPPRVQVTHLHAVLGEVVGQLLGHALGERGHQDPFPARHAQADLAEQVVHLRRGGPHLEARVDQARRRTTCSTICPEFWRS